MKPSLSSILFAIFSYSAVSLLAVETPAPKSFAPVRDFIQKGLQEGRAPSVAVAVVQNDRLVWAEGFGFADLEEKRPATADSIYRLASVSKPITATGLMLLVDRGQVELDKPANDYLPGPKLKAVRGAAKDITLRHLANHTSGMQVHYNFYYDDVMPLSHDEVIRRYGVAHLSPGTRVEYCNLAFGVLDYITEVVSRTPWRQFMEENLYDPIRMTHTSDRIRPNLESWATVQYQMDLAGNFVRVPCYRFDHDGASSIWSSANDLSCFLRLHLNGGAVNGERLLKEETARSMLRVTGARDPNNPNEGFGIAWHIGSHLGHRSFEHTGGMPGVATLVRGFPEDNAGFVVLLNSSGGGFTGQIGQHLTKALFPEAKDEAKANRGNAAGEGKECQFTGRWKGALAHYDGDIPMVLEVEKDGSASVIFGKAQAVALREVSLKNGTFQGQMRGLLKTQPGYHGLVTLEFQLTDYNGRLAGIAVAKAEGYFALSHGVDLAQDPKVAAH